MQAVILAGGEGTRFRPLSVTNPKPLFSVFGKSILEYNLDALQGVAEEAFIIVNYLEEKIKQKIGEKHGKIKVNYVHQEEVSGTGSAVRTALPYLKDKFIVLNGDDFYAKEDLTKLTKSFPSILVKEHDNPSVFGVVVENKGTVQEIVEKPVRPSSKSVNTGAYFLPKEIFDFNINKSARGEYEFTDYVKELIKKKDVFAVKASFWYPASYPWDVFNALEDIFNSLKKEKQGVIEKGVTIKGELIVKKGSLIKAGAYIEGKVYIGENCVIGPNCFIRGTTSIGNNCNIGQAVEIKNSIIGNNTNVRHLSYVGDSIIGSNCNFGALTTVANLRHDNDTIKTIVNNEIIDTKRKKFGTIIGDDVKTGINTLIFPGKKIWPNKTTMPGDKVSKDVE